LSTSQFSPRIDQERAVLAQPFEPGVVVQQLPEADRRAELKRRTKHRRHEVRDVEGIARSDLEVVHVPEVAHRQACPVDGNDPVLGIPDRDRRAVEGNERSAQGVQECTAVEHLAHAGNPRLDDALHAVPVEGLVEPDFVPRGTPVDAVEGGTEPDGQRHGAVAVDATAAGRVEEAPRVLHADAPHPELHRGGPRDRPGCDR
jgi:hypothetical protein